MSDAKPDSSVTAANSQGTTDEDNEVLAYFLGRMVERRRKEHLVSTLDPVDYRALATTIMLTSFVDEGAIAEARGTEPFDTIVNLCREAAAERRMTESLNLTWQRSRLRLIIRLARARRRLEDELLGRNSINVSALRQIDARRGLALRAKLVAHALQRLDRPRLRARHERLTASIEYVKHGLEGMLHYEALLGGLQGADICEYFAFVVARPESAIPMFYELDEDWHRFPLKWFSHELPMPDFRRLLRIFKRGESLSEYFVGRYDGGAEEHLEEISALSGVPLLRRRRDAVREAFRAYDLGLLNAAICTSLPLIEGMIWDFACIIHARYGDVSPTPEDAKRIGDLLASPRIREELDEHFIAYFCDELYPRRHPVLHGRAADAGCIHEAAAKLGAVEYLVRQLGEYATEETLKRLENLPEPTRSRIQKRIEAAAMKDLG